MNDSALIDVPRRCSGVREEQLEGELLLYVPSNTQAVYLNATAAVVWGLCDGSRSIGEIADILVESYPDAAADILAEVNETLTGLRKAHVISFIDSPDTPSAN